MTEHKPFIMPKPESAKFLAELEECINDSGYKIDGIWRVKDWQSTARALYADQLVESRDSSFVTGFESHVWMLNYLFGNRSLILTLDAQETSANAHLSMLEDVFAIKQKFRRNMKGCYDGTLLTLLDLSKIPELKYNGQSGLLGTSKGGVFKPLNNGSYDGSWDYVYFKYVHCPEPERNMKELDILKNLGIFNQENIITPSDWEIMKYQKTMIPPSEVKG
jgi:hypothetical protein